MAMSNQDGQSISQLRRESKRWNVPGGGLQPPASSLQSAAA